MITKDFVVVCDVCGEEQPIGAIYTPKAIADHHWAYSLDCDNEIALTVCQECAKFVRSMRKEKESV